MSLAMGPVLRLWTRAMYRYICLAPCWDQPMCLSSDSRSEVFFGNRTLTIWAPSPKIEVLSYSDASSLGWGGFVVHINGKPVVGSWSEEESGRSSTFCELRAIRYVKELYSYNLQGKEVCHKTDNRNAEIIGRQCWFTNFVMNQTFGSLWSGSEIIIVLLMSFQEWRILTSCWILSAFVIYHKSLRTRS